VNFAQVKSTNKHNSELRFQQSPLPMPAGRSFDFGGQQRHRPYFAHAFAILYIFHKGPVLVSAQLVEYAAAGEDSLVAGIASRAQRTPRDIHPNAFVKWAWVIKTHTKCSTCDAFILHDRYQIVDTPNIGQGIRVQKEQDIAA
jgi:hypothetical protein